MDIGFLATGAAAGFSAAVLSRGIPKVIEEDESEERSGEEVARGRLGSVTAVRWGAAGKLVPKVDLPCALVGLMAFAASDYFGLPKEYLAFIWVLSILSAIDFKTMLLPDALTIPLVWGGLLFATRPGGDMYMSIYGAVCGFLSLWLLTWVFFVLTGKVGMGGGDFKLLSAVGAWLGAYPLINVLLLASLSGLVFAAVKRIFFGKGEARQPFGPFIAFGAVIWLLFGKVILSYFS